MAGEARATTLHLSEVQDNQPSNETAIDIWHLGVLGLRVDDGVQPGIVAMYASSFSLQNIIPDVVSYLVPDAGSHLLNV